MVKETLATKMKAYEKEHSTYLQTGVPVLVRVDGNAFHSLTRHFERPFDKVFKTVMQKTAMYLFKKVHGCKLAYTQSDEISLLLIDYSSEKTEPWLNYRMEKVLSISAGKATMAFNKYLREEVDKLFAQDNISEEEIAQYMEYYKKLDSAVFDSRAFNLPKEEVNLYFRWRQEDAMNNSLQMLAQTMYSHKQLLGIKTEDLKQKLITEKEINWGDVDPQFRRGSVIVRPNLVKIKNVRNNPFIEEVTPLFSEDKDYVNRFVYTTNEKE